MVNSTCGYFERLQPPHRLMKRINFLSPANIDGNDLGFPSSDLPAGTNTPFRGVEAGRECPRGVSPRGRTRRSGCDFHAGACPGNGVGAGARPAEL